MKLPLLGRSRRRYLRSRRSPGVRFAFKYAKREARAAGFGHSSPEFLLMAIITHDSGLGVECLKILGVDCEEMNAALANASDSLPRRWSVDFRNQIRMDSVLPKAWAAARDLGHRWIGTEHLIIALVSMKGTKATHILREFGLTIGSTKRCVDEVVCGKHNDRIF